MTDTTGKKDTQKLQRAIVDALEDVKAQDIQVFNTEHLSPLFERVIMASGTSNRQTKALAASVRDKVREAGFPKPRIEGEDNGEWIIVDCGAAVAHVMQPSIRQYYNLEEIWGDKPVRLKFGAPKPAVKVEAPVAKKVAAKTTRAAAGAGAKATEKAPAKAPARRAAAKTTTVSPSPQPTSTAKAGDKSAKPAVKRTTTAVKTPVTKVVVPAAAKRAPAKKAAAPAKAARPKRAPAKKAAPGRA